MDFRFDVIYEYRWVFLYGMLTILRLTVVVMAGGSILSLLLALAHLISPEKAGASMHALAQVLRKISFWYVTLFCSMPSLVQTVIWAYVWFSSFAHLTDGMLISGEAVVNLCRSYGALIAGSLALIANSGAYIRETFRAGTQSTDKGQMEAVCSLDLAYIQAMYCVILPQTSCRVLPPLASEFITLLKDSSLLSVIGVAELAYVQSTITGRYSVYEEPLYTTVLIYLVLTSVLDWVFLRSESRYNPQYRQSV